MVKIKLKVHVFGSCYTYGCHCKWCRLPRPRGTGKFPSLENMTHFGAPARESRLRSPWRWRDLKPMFLGFRNLRIKESNLDHWSNRIWNIPSWFRGIELGPNSFSPHPGGTTAVPLLQIMFRVKFALENKNFEKIWILFKIWRWDKN